MNNLHSTDIEREEFELKDDQDMLKEILIMVGTTVLTLIVIGTSILVIFARNGFFDSI